MRMIVNLWRYWLAAVHSVVPAIIYLPGFRREWSHPINFSSWEAASDQLTLEILKQKHCKIPIDVILGAGFFLSRRIGVPQKARSEADKVLRLSLQRALPLPLSVFFWQNFYTNTQNGMAQFEQRIVKKKHVFEVVELLEKTGLTVRSVSLYRSNRLKPIVDNRWEIDRLRNIWAVAAILSVAVVCSLFVWGRWSDFHALQVRTDAIHNALLEKRSQLVERISEQKQEKDQSLQYENARKLIRTQKFRGKIIEIISDSFPQNTWASEFELVGDSVNLGGFTKGDIGEIIKTLTNHPSISSADLAGSLSSDNDGQRRFRMMIKLEGSSQ